MLDAAGIVASRLALRLRRKYSKASTIRATPATAPTTMPAIAPPESDEPDLAGLPSAVYTRSELIDQYASPKAAGVFCTNDWHVAGHPDWAYVAPALLGSVLLLIAHCLPRQSVPVVYSLVAAERNVEHYNVV